MQSTDRKPLSTAPKSKLVKCKLCGKFIDMRYAFVVIKGAKREYYCSKEEWEGGEEYVDKRRWMEENIKNTVFYIIDASDIPAPIYDPVFTGWLQYAKIGVINDYLSQKCEIIESLIASKGILTVDKKLKYLDAIIKNNILKFEASMPSTQHIKTEKPNYEIYIPKMTPRSGIRRSMEELEDEYGS